MLKDQSLPILSSHWITPFYKVVPSAVFIKFPIDQRDTHKPVSL